MRILKSLYFTSRFFFGLAAIFAALVLSYFVPVIFPFAKWSVLVLSCLALVEVLMLFRWQNGLEATRETPDRLSNGDQNFLQINLENRYPFKSRLQIIDEIPHQFQVRDFELAAVLEPRQSKSLSYTLRPTVRGVYQFGALNVFVSSEIGLIQRRFRFDEGKEVAVYPSFLQMRRYELYAISNRLTEVGIKKIRRIGQATNFEQIRNYVAGDEIRTVNWNATARKNELMVNQYEEEKSQQVFSVIDMGRAMQMPFEGMSLLDYAINASLVISNIAMHKQDKAGLITFAESVKTMLKADRRQVQMQRILELLYSAQTDFKEPDYVQLYASIRHNIRQRSLLLLYTNFESLESMKRRLPMLKRLAAQHVLVVIFFENTEIKSLLESKTKRTEDIYVKTIAEKNAYERREIVRELHNNGIHSILTTPDQLSVNTLNKYLELKARGLI